MSFRSRDTVLPSDGKIRSKNGKCVTVKAEDRPSGSAGDSASVSASAFPYFSRVEGICVCLSGGAKRRRSRIKTTTYFYGQF